MSRNTTNHNQGEFRVPNILNLSALNLIKISEGASATLFCDYLDHLGVDGLSDKAVITSALARGAGENCFPRAHRTAAKSVSLSSPLMRTIASAFHSEKFAACKNVFMTGGCKKWKAQYLETALQGVPLIPPRANYNCSAPVQRPEKRRAQSEYYYFPFVHKSTRVHLIDNETALSIYIRDDDGPIMRRFLPDEKAAVKQVPRSQQTQLGALGAE